MCAGLLQLTLHSVIGLVHPGVVLEALVDVVRILLEVVLAAGTTTGEPIAVLARQ